MVVLCKIRSKIIKICVFRTEKLSYNFVFYRKNIIFGV